MPPHVFLPFVLLLLGCVPDSESASSPEELRVGAPWGISGLSERFAVSGSAAGAKFLLMDPADHHLSATKADGATLYMTVHKDCSYSPTQLAEAFRTEAQAQVSVNPEGKIVARFATELDALRARSPLASGFAVGPFTLSDVSPREATLSRAKGVGFQRIHIQELSASDEWRLFRGGALDVMPRVSRHVAERFLLSQSVRVERMQSGHRLGLLFNMKSEAVRSVDVRRRLLRAIDRTALVRIFGGPLKDEWITEPAPIGAHADLPSLRLVYLGSDAELDRVAKTLDFQISLAGVSVSLERLELKAYSKRIMDGDFEVTLLPIPGGQRGYSRFLSAERGDSTNIMGFALPEYDANYDAGRDEQLEGLLRQHLPVIFLYEMETFAIFDSSLCLPKTTTPSPTSWRWIADLYPCNEGPQ